jgi:hypothetical protein
MGFPQRESADRDPRIGRPPPAIKRDDIATLYYRRLECPSILIPCPRFQEKARPFDSPITEYPTLDTFTLVGIFARLYLRCPLPRAPLMPKLTSPSGCVDLAFEYSEPVLHLLHTARMIGALFSRLRLPLLLPPTSQHLFQLLHRARRMECILLHSVNPNQY